MSKISKLLPFLAIIVLLQACNIDSDAPFDPDANIGNGDDNNNDAFATEMLAAVNQLRSDGCTCGNTEMPPVPALTWDSKLQAAALRHTTDMSDNDHFEHTGTDGSSAGERISDAGYSWGTYGENIAWGYNSIEAVIEGWKNSEGHCKNMMSANFTQIGVARVENYWTQVFAKPQ